MVSLSSAGRFARAALRFVGRVLKRSFAAVILVLLRVSDFYAQHVSPRLSQDWRDRLDPIVAYLGQFTWWVIWIIVLAAAVWTYWEVEREVHRDPKIGRQLKLFYARSGEMLQRQVKDNAELKALQHEMQAFYTEVNSWAGANLEPASVARLSETRMQLPYGHRKGTLNDEHQMWINGLSITHENLRALIESDTWR